MIRFITNKSVYLSRTSEGKQMVRAELICDTASELAGVTELDGAVLAFGSMAVAAKESRLCILASDGKWYCEGAEVTADA